MSIMSIPTRLLITLLLLGHVLVAVESSPGATTPAAAAPGKVLIVVTSHRVLGKAGLPTGFWLTEVAHPYHELTTAGFQVDFASPQGGAAPMDPYSDPGTANSTTKDDLVAQEFLANPVTKQAIAATTPLAKVDPAAYRAVIIAGGSGAAFDLADDVALQRIVANLWSSDRVVAAICHGTAGLLNVQLADGSYLIAGKRITGFSNAEEAIVHQTIGQDGYLPFYIETEVPKRGGTFACIAPFQPYAIVDGGGRLITGQQNYSGTQVGRLVVEALHRRP